MLASISLTTFNRKKLSKYCIKTVHERTPRQEYEFIVVDNGSTDGTVEMLKRYKASGVIDRLVLNHFNNLGLAINDAWKLANPKAVWLIVLSNDHFCMEGWFENLKLVIESEIKPDYILANLWMPGFRKKVPHRTLNGGSYVVRKGRWKRGYPFGGGLVIRQKSVRKRRLQFMTGLTPFEGGSIYTHFCRRLYKMKLRFVELGKPCILTQDVEFANPAYWSYYKRLFMLPEKVARSKSGVTKFEFYKKQGGLTKFPDKYYEGSDYEIGRHYKEALKKQGLG